MTDRNKNTGKENWKNREDQDLRKDVNRGNEPAERSREEISRTGEEKDSKKKKVANIPGENRADTSSRSSNDMTSGGLSNSRTGRERTRVPSQKTFISGTDTDGQSV